MRKSALPAGCMDCSEGVPAVRHNSGSGRPPDAEVLLSPLPSLPPSPLRHCPSSSADCSLAAALSAVPDDLGELCLCLPDVAFDLGDLPVARSDSADL